MYYVFNIGFNRSGTTSLTLALNVLGIPSIHYITKNKKLLINVIETNIRNNKNLFYSLDADYFGFSDFGQKRQHYKKLYSQYPNSKFILTIRDVDEWAISVANLQIELGKLSKNTEIYMQLQKKYYNKKLAEIRDFFSDKKNQFLEIRICDGEGWETLCPFLGLEIPDVPFPYENKSLDKSIKTNIL